MVHTVCEGTLHPQTICASAHSRVADRATSSHAYACMCHSIMLLLRESAICLPLAHRGQSAAKDRLSGVRERGTEEMQRGFETKIRG